MDTTRNIKQYNQVFELYQDLGISIDQKAEFSIHSLLELHSQIPYKSPVFRANYYSFIFVKDGRGNYTTDEHTFHYSDNTVYFTNPGHLKGFEFVELSDAYLITLSESFLKRNVHKDVFKEFPFLLAETIPPQTFTPGDFVEIRQLYTQILKEYQGDSPFKYQIIGNLFVVLLLKLKQNFWADYYPLEEGNRNSQIVKTFKRQLEEHYLELSNGETEKPFHVKDYAAAQSLSTSYFNQVIKSKTGKPTSVWIAEKSLGLAQALLKNSSLSIKELAYQLGYRETAHFSNFFRKHTGLSPSQYRMRRKEE